MTGSKQDRIWLSMHLRSETCFSRGDGVPGVVDTEVKHDPKGLPYLAGRTLKGLLHAEAAAIMCSLSQINATNGQRWQKAAVALFGKPGSRSQGGILHVGDARLPEAVRTQLVLQGGLTPADVLDTLTTIRRQTKIDPETGAPQENTLRAVRVIL
ncbi:MAG: hypothetical protein KDE28_21425, partial [Anaerolineales bacterium]|nr:hypothetical protein [Anaerolineales bacterium]